MAHHGRATHDLIAKLTSPSGRRFAHDKTSIGLPMASRNQVHAGSGLLSRTILTKIRHPANVGDLFIPKTAQFIDADPALPNKLPKHDEKGRISIIVLIIDRFAA